MPSGLSALPFGYVALLAFWTVLAAELVGDKSMYTVTSLSLRFRLRSLLAGIALAFGGKMVVAVLLSRVIVQLHSQWTDILSAAAFFASALFIWFKEVEQPAPERSPEGGEWRAVAVCFGALFLTEWGDPGQIAAAALAAKSSALLATWLGGTLAMTTKGVLALAIGVQLRDRLPRALIRVIASASCCVLGVLALEGLVFR